MQFEEQNIICETPVEEMPMLMESFEETAMEESANVQPSGEEQNQEEQTMEPIVKLNMELEKIPEKEVVGGKGSLLERLNMEKALKEENAARAKGALYFYCYLAFLVLLILVIKMIQLAI